MDEVEHRRRRVRGAKGDGSRVDTAAAVPDDDVSIVGAAITMATTDEVGAALPPTPADMPPGSAHERSVAPSHDRSGGDRSRVDRTVGGGSWHGPSGGSGHGGGGSGGGGQSGGNGHGSAHDDRENERGLRGLVGGGSTQVTVTAAMRARDAARPTEADIANAEAHLAIVHRGWTPREPA